MNLPRGSKGKPTRSQGVQGDEGVIDGDHLKRVNNGLTMFALYPATLLYTYT